MELNVYAILYRPGPAWRTGKPVWEQPLYAHGQYVHGLHLQGRLVMGGPFDGESGGMVLVRAGSLEEAERIVVGDPAVAQGVFTARAQRFHPVNWSTYGPERCIAFVEELTAVLGATPGVLRNLLAGLPKAWWYESEGEGTWCAYDVVSHLLHGEETDWLPRVRILLVDGESRAFSPFVRDPDERTETRHELLLAFAARRAESIAELRGLGLVDADLERAGTHPEFGRVTLRELLCSWSTHDLSHVRQIARILAKRAGREVGPWRAYLPVVGEMGGDSGDPTAREHGA